MTPDLLTNLLTQILSCACGCLNTLNPCPSPCRAFISAGPPVFDLEACCDDGQLSIHIDRIYSHENFPAEQGRVNLCQTPLAAEIVVTLLRCFPGVKEDGSAPTADEIGSASERIYRDLYILTNCILCNLAFRGRRQKSIFKDRRIFPPQGGCIGIEVRFIIELSDPLPFFKEPVQLKECCPNTFIGFCLADKTPIAIVLKDGLPTGWTNILTGIFTPGLPPPETGIFLCL